IKSVSTIDCIGSPKLEVYPTYKRVSNDINWRRIEDSEMIELSLPHDKEQVKVCKLILNYVCHGKDKETGFECRFLCERRQPVLHDSLSDIRDSFQYLPSTDNKINCYAVNLLVPNSAKYIQLHFGVSSNSVLYLHSDVGLQQNAEKFLHKYVLPKSIG